MTGQSPEQATAARAAKRLMPGWYALSVIVLSTLAMALLAIGIAQHTAGESERKWCALIVTLDDAYHQTPPSTTLGRQLAADMAQLRRDLGCP